jgi:hypothetical protein
MDGGRCSRGSGRVRRKNTVNKAGGQVGDLPYWGNYVSDLYQLLFNYCDGRRWLYWWSRGGR